MLHIQSILILSVDNDLLEEKHEIILNNELAEEYPPSHSINLILNLIMIKQSFSNFFSESSIKTI